jgi:hypothetical protein
MPTLHTAPAPHWHGLPDHEQLELSRAALMQAAHTIADQADSLAETFDDGTLRDLGGADALRLFARVLRAVHGETAVGNA